MIIFFYGEDSFRSHQKLIEIKKKYLQSDKSGSGLSSFDAQENFSANKVVSVLSMPNLLAPKRLVIVKRLISDAGEQEQKEMLNFLEKRKESILKDTDLVLVFWESEMPRKNNALFKFLEKNSKKQSFEKLSGIKLDSWILGQIKELNAEMKISRAAIQKLISYVGSGSMELDSEIQKLVNHAAKNQIEESDVDALVRAGMDSNIFQTVDALANKNKKEALRMLHNHLSLGDDPFYVFSMFVYQFRNLLKIADLKEQGTSEYEITKASKLHPFVVKKSLTQLRNFSFSQLKSIYQKLADMDMKIKTGKMDIKAALDMFVVELQTFPHILKK